MVRRSKKKTHRHARRGRPINVLASIATTMNLYMGVLSIYAAITHEFEKAAFCILGGIIFDILDGFVARLTNSISDFGKELDSLCDVVTFGVAPGVLIFVSYLPETMNSPLNAQAESVIGKVGSYMGLFYAICTALRLARYNTFQSGRRDFFTGLPSPAAAGTVATFVIFLQYFESRLYETPNGILAFYSLGPLAVGLALLMVSTVRYPRNRYKQFVLSPRSAFRALGFFAFLVVLVDYAITFHWSVVLFPMGMAYVLYGIADTLSQKWSTRNLEPEFREETTQELQELLEGGAEKSSERL
jgi:CDP-diacylglycerol--serine O-phosphatidyltransferase